jgi:hypothetical protein
MTEEELEIVRLKLKMEVHLVLLRMLYSGLANTVQGAGDAIRAKFAELRAEHDKIVLLNLPEGYSDMIAAEYQEALKDALSLIEGGIRT